MFFPETRNGMMRSPSSAVFLLLAAVTVRSGRSVVLAQPAEAADMKMLRRSAGDVKGRLFLATALDRGGNPHRFPVFRDRAARNVDAGLAQPVHDGIVGQDVSGILGVDQLANAMANRLGRVRFAAFRRCDRRGEEILQLED